MSAMKKPCTHHEANVADEKTAGHKRTETTQFELAAILDSSDDAIIGQDLKGIINAWSKGAERMFGYSASEMIGLPVTQLIPADRRDEGSLILDALRRGEKVHHFETLRQAKDGGLIRVSITASPIKDADGCLTGACEIAREKTDLMERERELARMTRLYAALSQINQAIVWTTSREELFPKVCQILVEHGGFHMAWIGWHNPDTNRIMPVAVSGKESDYLSTVSIHGDNGPEGHEPTGQAVLKGQPFICNDLHHNPVTLPWRPQLARRGFQASASLPIRVKNEIFGALTVYSEDPWFFRDKEIALLVEAAGDISFALGNFADKACRKRIEEAAENERLFSATMIESMPGVLYFYDEQGRFLRWNRNFEIVSGYTHEEIARMHPLDFFSDQDKGAIRQRIDEVFEKGDSFIEASFRAKDGRLTPYFFTGRRILYNGLPCLVGMGVDVSQRKWVELKLQEAQGQLEAVVENLREGLVIADPDGDFLRWNPASLRMLGFIDLEEGRKRQLEFRTIFELYNLDGSRLPPERWPLGRVRQGETLDGLELRVCRINSDWERIFSYSGTLVNYPNDKKLAFMTMRDVTERKQTETAMRVLNKTLELEVAARTSELQSALLQAKSADRMKSAFLATMSHELRTPLNSIIGFTGIILQGLAGPLNHEQSKQLEMVRNSSRHLLELINDVLDLSKIEAGQLELRVEPFQVQNLLEKVVAWVKPLADRKKLELSVVAPDGLEEMISDRLRVEQLLLNLVNNAVKFTDHGRVTVTAESVATYQPSPEAPPKPAVRLRVADTGSGIKPEDLPMLFQPFHQLDTGSDRRHEGTGLGLAISRRLANLLGGDISVTSEWSKGSEFTVIIPVQKPADP